MHQLLVTPYYVVLYREDVTSLAAQIWKHWIQQGESANASLVALYADIVDYDET